MSKPVCRHCGNPSRPVNRPRGLCHRCYYSPGVADQYPPTSKFAKRSPGSEYNGASRLPAAPIPYPPGTREREEAMSERVARGESVFHPADARADLS